MLGPGGLQVNSGEIGGATGPTEINKLDRPQFGQAGGTFNPRQLQFGLKLSF